MIIKHLEERVKAPIEEVEFSLISNTRLVKFGWFGVYDSELKTFIELWMGEYDEQLKTFKFFRTIRKTDKTSDFYVKGKLLGHLEYHGEIWNRDLLFSTIRFPWIDRLLLCLQFFDGYSRVYSS